MAYNMSDEDLVKRAISDPSWALFYHRSHIKLLLPAMAQAYLLVGAIQKDLLESQERDRDRVDHRKPECVENWPDCENGKYNPLCCRFPKSCSC